MFPDAFVARLIVSRRVVHWSALVRLIVDVGASDQRSRRIASMCGVIDRALPSPHAPLADLDVAGPERARDLFTSRSACTLGSRALFEPL